MKKLLLGATLASFALTSSVSAGSLKDPIVEKDIVATQAAGSSDNGTGVVLFLTLVMFAAAIHSGGGGGMNASDARLKTDITPVGTADNGLTLYHFRYVGLPMVYEGVMAQDVLTHSPDAVIQMPGGYMAVDYDALGLEMRRIR